MFEIDDIVQWPFAGGRSLIIHIKELDDEGNIGGVFLRHDVDPDLVGTYDMGWTPEDFVKIGHHVKTDFSVEEIDLKVALNKLESCLNREI